MTFRFSRIYPAAKIPNRATKHSAAYDLYAIENAILPADGTQIAVSTGIKLIFDDDIKYNHHAKIYPRSGLAVKHSISVGAGLIDSDYNGEIKVVLYVTNSIEYKISVGDKIAQIIIEKHVINEQKPTDETAIHSGFGSTGNN